MRGIHLALLGTGVMAVGVAGAVLAFSDPHPHDPIDGHRPDAQAAPTPVSTPTLRPLIPLVPIPEPTPDRRTPTTPFVAPRAAVVPASSRHSLSEHAVTAPAVRRRPQAAEPAARPRTTGDAPAAHEPAARPTTPHRRSRSAGHDTPPASSPDRSCPPEHTGTQRQARPVPGPGSRPRTGEEGESRHRTGRSEGSRFGSDDGSTGGERHSSPRDPHHGRPATTSAPGPDSVDDPTRSVHYSHARP